MSFYNRIICCVAGCVFFITAAWAEPPQGREWVRTFWDEFDGTALNTVKWKDRYAWGRTHNYDAFAAPENVIVSGGTLRLKAENKPSHNKKFTTGVVTTHERFAQQYGYFEGRFRIPKGKGFWPAFWMLPYPQTWPPEIDIFEFINDARTVYTTYHYDDPASFDPNDYLSSGAQWTGPDFSAEFHDFGMEWDEGKIVWYVDGVEKFRFTKAEHVPQEPMYMLINFAVGANWPGWPDASTLFPAYFEADWVRVYQTRERLNPSTVEDGMRHEGVVD